jgi:glutaminyl-tRNA synthetase
MALISNGHVCDWDDPRLYTLIALRRRGVPPGAILSFVNGLGVSKATTTIEVKNFEQSVRQYLEVAVPRLMVVLDPIPVIIDNLPEDYMEMVELPFSKDPEFGVRLSHALSLSRTNPVSHIAFRSLEQYTSIETIFARRLARTSSGLLQALQSACSRYHFP